MKSLGILVTILILVYVTAYQKKRDKREATLLEMQAELKALRDQVDKQQKVEAALGQQLIMNQLAMEERIRSEGGSGLKQIRVNKDGTRPYHSAHHAFHSVAAMHDHSNNIRTTGLGEFIAVMNGVEFRTRHNDYRLKQPHKTSSGYHEVQDVEFPEVPPEVTAKATVEEQIAEMRLWFKAFAKQDHTVRDYRKYFKPVLTYIEGSWTFSSDHVEEGFDSDRHHIDAATWYELQQKVKFTSATGRKDQLENYAYLPTTIVDMVNGTEPLIAQWNFRILCHPLQRDLPTQHLRPIDDVANRFKGKVHYTKYLHGRSVRYQVTEQPPTKEESVLDSLLDELMAEVPGPDNYQGNIIDDAMGATAYPIDKTIADPLNAAFYNRYYKVKGKGAMGLNTRKRGFSDRSLFVALTSHEKVPAFSYTNCKKDICTTYGQRPVYALPLEIIFLTPLNRWNPYNITYKGEASSKEGMTVKSKNKDGIKRNGDLTPELAYNGSNSNTYYLTPADFFSSDEGEVDPADTTQNLVGVLDENGEVRAVKASGVRINFPEIQGVGTVRQRYPIMPIHAEGSTTWKQTAALEDALMSMESYMELYKNVPPVEDRFTGYNDNSIYTFHTTVSVSSSITAHYHEFNITAAEFNYLKTGKKMNVTTSEVMGHSHTLKFGYGLIVKYWKYFDCFEESNFPSQKWRCSDGHGARMSFIRTS